MRALCVLGAGGIADAVALQRLGAHELLVTVPVACLLVRALEGLWDRCLGAGVLSLAVSHGAPAGGRPVQ